MRCSLNFTFLVPSVNVMLFPLHKKLLSVDLMHFLLHLLYLALDVTQFLLHIFCVVCCCDASSISHLEPSGKVMQFVLNNFIAVCCWDTSCTSYILCCTLMWRSLHFTIYCSLFMSYSSYCAPLVLSFDVLQLEYHIECCRAHWGMRLFFHQAKHRWTKKEEDSMSSVLDLCLGNRSWAATSLNV